jgi:hypothetical protein
MLYWTGLSWAEVSPPSKYTSNPVLKYCDGAPSWDTCNYLTFSSNNQYLSGSDANLPVGSSSRSVQAWIKTSASYPGWTFGSIVEWGLESEGDRFGLLIGLDGVAYFVGGGNDVAGSIKVNDGILHKITVTFNAPKIRLYIDGMLDREGDVNLDTAGSILRIGRSDGQAEQYYGAVKRLEIYNRELSGSEITATSQNLSGLVSRYFLHPYGDGGIVVTDELNSETTLSYYGFQ